MSMENRIYHVHDSPRVHWSDYNSEGFVGIRAYDDGQTWVFLNIESRGRSVMNFPRFSKELETLHEKEVSEPQCSQPCRTLFSLASPNERIVCPRDVMIQEITYLLRSLLLGYWFSLATPNLPLSTSAKNLDLVDGLIVNSFYRLILPQYPPLIVRNLLITKVRGNVLQLHVLNWR